MANPCWRGFVIRVYYFADYLLFNCAPIANRRERGKRRRQRQKRDNKKPATFLSAAGLFR